MLINEDRSRSVLNQVVISLTMLGVAWMLLTRFQSEDARPALKPVRLRGTAQARAIDGGSAAATNEDHHAWENEGGAIRVEP
jgi:hypothetical protein